MELDLSPMSVCLDMIKKRERKFEISHGDERNFTLRKFPDIYWLLLCSTKNLMHELDVNWHEF